jgi:hypothetical protein
MKEKSKPSVKHSTSYDMKCSECKGYETLSESSFICVWASREFDSLDVEYEWCPTNMGLKKGDYYPLRQNPKLADIPASTLYRIYESPDDLLKRLRLLREEMK